MLSGNTAYCLAKGDMRMLTRTAGVELAKRDIPSSGSIRAVATPINLSTMDCSAKLAQFNAAIPLGCSVEYSQLCLLHREGGIVDRETRFPFKPSDRR
jgi:glucose 1-dehydrogenase